MFTYADLAKLQAQSLKMQGHIRHQTYSPEMEKTLRRFSSWEVAELIFKTNPSTLRGRRGKSRKKAASAGIRWRKSTSCVASSKSRTVR